MKHLIFTALLALAPLCPADDATLQQQLDSYARNSRTQSPPAPELMEKGRAIWEGKQSASPEDLAAFSIYARAELSKWRPEYRVSPDQSIFLCHLSTLLEEGSQLLHMFAVFHREGDRFVCKNRYDFYSQAFCDMRKIAFEPDGVVLHFLLQQYDDTPKVTASLKIRFDTPWHKNYLLSSSREAERLSDKLSWRFVHAVEQMDTATIDAFMRHGYTPDQTMPDQLREDHGDECLFFRALRWCEDDELAAALPYLLQLYKQDLNAQDKEDDSALSSVLSYGGKPRAVKMLLDAGADPNLANSLKRTPLMLAASCVCPLSVKHLLDAGADVHARDYQGYTPMHWLLDHSGWHMKDAQGNWEKITRDLCADTLETARILVAAGADINAAAESNGQPPFFLLLHSRADTLDEALGILLPELVKLGADLSRKDAAGSTFADLLPAHCVKTRQLLDSLTSTPQK